MKNECLLTRNKLKIYIAGIKGMLGTSLEKLALEQGYTIFGKSSRELDLTNRESVFAELTKIQPDVLILAAAKVGGIGGNIENPVAYLSTNLQISVNVLDACFAAEVPKVIFVASSCIYPRNSTIPISEGTLLTGPFEPTNEPYSLAKMAGIKLVNAYRSQHKLKWVSVLPTNLYGPNDNFNEKTSHVLPSLMARIHKAKIKKNTEVKIWGDGSPMREFLHADDAAGAIFTVIEKYDSDIPVNIGTGKDISISELVKELSNIIKFDGNLIFDQSKPNGVMRKLIDSTTITSLGWAPKIEIKQGLQSTYDWYQRNEKSLRQ